MSPKVQRAKGFRQREATEVPSVVPSNLHHLVPVCIALH
jgi:hypothetical protein